MQRARGRVDDTSKPPSYCSSFDLSGSLSYSLWFVMAKAHLCDTLETKHVYPYTYICRRQHIFLTLSYTNKLAMASNLIEEEENLLLGKDCFTSRASNDVQNHSLQDQRCNIHGETPENRSKTDSVTERRRIKVFKMLYIRKLSYLVSKFAVHMEENTLPSFMKERCLFQVCWCCSQRNFSGSRYSHALSPNYILGPPGT